MRLLDAGREAVRLTDHQDEFGRSRCPFLLAPHDRARGV